MKLLSIVLLLAISSNALSLKNSYAKKELRFSKVSQDTLTRDDNDWDYLLYVSRWPGTVSQDSLPSYITDFTLHGVWPTRNDGSYPSFCNSSYPFSNQSISDLVSELWTVWYDYTGDGYDFWSHEWDKHGTCALSLQAMDSEHAYFYSAIGLHKSFDPTEILSNAGILPSDSDTYDSKDILDALQKGYGVSVSITCSSVSGFGNSLDTIQLCVDKNFEAEECPTNYPSNCDGSVYLPPINYE